MEPQLDPECAAVDVALTAWRQKATNIILGIVALAHLPVVVLGILGHGPQMGPLLKVTGLAAYLVLATAALLQRAAYRPRVIATLLAMYPALAAVNIALPQGPYAQIGTVTLPIFALVLLGASAGRVAALVSIAILLSTPFVRMQPEVIHFLGINPVHLTELPELLWFRIVAKSAPLLTVLVLLDRFHSFLADALTARVLAQRKMEREMGERQRLEREIAAVGDGERRRLGQELHDGVCQQVTAALLRCQALERRLEKGGIVSCADFGPLSSLLADTIDDAHNVARGLCPLEAEPEALAPALRALGKRIEEMAGVRCGFRAIGDVRVPDPQAAQHLYRIAQEALSNAVRHAKASNIALELRADNGELILQVEDDGVGLPAGPRNGGMGLRTMAYRAEIMKGELTIASVSERGTRIVCRVPRPTGTLVVEQHA